LDLEALPAPPPKEPSEIEPPLREEEDPWPSSIEGPQEHRNEVAPSGEVD
jgi:hypothetical protein